jgi:LmbE family N-acetylglucosaminyl deacetylase
VRHVYLSPHLDDAVLSCGGGIDLHSASGARALVMTVFAGEFGGGELSPFARLQHTYWGDPPQPMALRRAEDRAALTLLDAEARHLDYLDAVYRAGPDGEWLYSREEVLWQRVHPSDPMGQRGAQALADRLADQLPPRDQTTVYAPLGVGQHVDHQIVHAAARRLLEMGYQVAFYEDYPYAEKPGATAAGVAAAGAGRWRIEAVSLRAEDMVAKTSALGYYRSQMFVLFGGAEVMPNRLWAFAASRVPQVCLAERIWWPTEG